MGCWEKACVPCLCLGHPWCYGRNYYVDNGSDATCSKRVACFRSRCSIVFGTIMPNDFLFVGDGLNRQPL